MYKFTINIMLKSYESGKGSIFSYKVESKNEKLAMNKAIEQLMKENPYDDEYEYIGQIIVLPLS